MTQLGRRKVKALIEAIPVPMNRFATTTQGPANEAGVVPPPVTVYNIPEEPMKHREYAKTLKFFVLCAEFKFPKTVCLSCFAEGLAAAEFPIPPEDMSLIGKYGVIAVVSALKDVQRAEAVEFMTTALRACEYREPTPDPINPASNAAIDGLVAAFREYSVSVKEEREEARKARLTSTPGAGIVQSLNEQQEEALLPHYDSHRRLYILSQPSHHRRLLYPRLRHWKVTTKEASATKDFPHSSILAAALVNLFAESEALATAMEIPNTDERTTAVKAYVVELERRWNALPSESLPGAEEALALHTKTARAIQDALDGPAIPTQDATPLKYHNIMDVAELALFVHRDRSMKVVYHILRRLLVARLAPAVFQERDEVAWFARTEVLPKAGCRFTPGF